MLMSCCTRLNVAVIRACEAMSYHSRIHVSNLLLYSPLPFLAHRSQNSKDVYNPKHVI